MVEETTIYCEFCGAPAGTARNPQRLIEWIHNVSKNVVRCNKHQRTSKQHKTCRTFDPYTGVEK